MPYIGNQPAQIAAYGVQSFNGGGTSFTLSKPATTETVLLFIDGVRQTPTDAYSVSGTTLTTTATTPSGTNNVTVQFLGDVVDFGEPSDNSVTSNKIVDGTIVNADINASAAIDASKTTAVPLSGGTMTGTLQMADQIVQRPEIKDYSETYNASSGSGTVDLDLETGNVFQHTASGGNVTFTFSNPPASGKAGSFTLKWIQDSLDRTITWPASVDWAGGAAPDVTSGSAKVDIYVFTTFDGGTTWYGFQSGADMA
jgi:hypothetical protein